MATQSRAWVFTEFPLLDKNGYDETSNEDIYYNCIGWAAGVTEWWEDAPQKGYKWPGRNCNMRIEGLVSVFQGLGYSTCNDGQLESGYEKVVLYERNGIYKHAARQLPSGKWTSKLGQEHDCEHATPTCLCGIHYGRIHSYMKRPIGTAR